MNLEELVRVRCFLLDMDGTILLSDHLLPGAERLLDVLRRRSIEFLILTNNSSKRRAQYGEKLRGLGLDVPDEQVFTSGEAAAIYLNGQMPGSRVYLVGTPPLEEMFHNAGFELVETDAEVAVLGFDTTLTYEKLWRLCDYVRAGLPYMATHPDVNCPLAGGDFMPDIGAMIAFVEASTGRLPDVVVGKPNVPIVEAVQARMGIPLDETCMVGDRLYTDIALGQAGIKTVLVLSGETQQQDIPSAPWQPDFVMQNLDELADALESLHA